VVRVQSWIFPPVNPRTRHVAESNVNHGIGERLGHILGMTVTIGHLGNLPGPPILSVSLLSMRDSTDGAHPTAAGELRACGSGWD
jgi:hypothetical protein